MARPTILTVDDDPTVSEAITHDLQARYGADYRIVRTTSGAQALDVLGRLALRDRPVAAIVTRSDRGCRKARARPSRLAGER